MKPASSADALLSALEAQHPDANTELHFTTAFQLLVATILSAQSTDARVNLTTPALFRRYPTPAALASAVPAELEEAIHATGFFRQKARALIGMARQLVETHAGQVPADMASLTALPGVGRKTANVVLGHALGVPGLPVDRHVLRVSQRLGLADSDDPIKVEQQLCALIPPARWTRCSDTLILHGRRVCKPTPICERCSATPWCAFYRSAERERPVPPASARAHRRAPAGAAKAAPVAPRARRAQASRPAATAPRRPRR